MDEVRLAVTKAYRIVEMMGGVRKRKRRATSRAKRPDKRSKCATTLRKPKRKPPKQRRVTKHRPPLTINKRLIRLTQSSNRTVMAEEPSFLGTGFHL